MKNYQVILEYDGSFYNGLQQQKDTKNTIYTKVHNALLKVFKEDVNELNFCGRTDAGVHAFGQVFNVKTDFSFIFPEGKLALAINFHLKGERISAVSSRLVEDDFHARYSCVLRVYKYKILNRSFKSPIYEKRAWLVPYKLSLEDLKEIAEIFIGTHDFVNFRNIDCTAKSTIKTIKSIEVVISSEGLIEITISAPSFLYNMVRNLVGCMVEFARGKITKEQVLNKLGFNVNSLSTQVAPAYGLYFVRAVYF
jgi:tRNA pseudouridine38-40 synthase